MGKGNMAKRVIACTTLLFMVCVCSGYALTIPGIDRIYAWLGINKNDRPGESGNATAELSPTPTPTPTLKSPAKFTPTAEELQRIPIMPEIDLVMDVSSSSIWPPADYVDWATFDQLECEGIPVGDGQSKMYRHPTPYPGYGKPVVLLKLKGDYWQMGYAHGWALAHEIWALWNNKVRDLVMPQAGWCGRLYVPDYIDTEMQGIVAGINARCRADKGEALTQEETFTPDYLFLMNAMPWFMACSSFSNWRTGNRLIGRNTDCTYYDSYGDKLFWRSGLVISREPSIWGHRKVVELTVPGRIAAPSCINNEGWVWLGHAGGPLRIDDTFLFCWPRLEHCKSLPLNVIWAMHTGAAVGSLVNLARSDFFGAAIVHLFDKTSALSIESTGLDYKERGPVSGDPPSTLVVVAGCPKEWGSTYTCGSKSQSGYDVLVERINYVFNNPPDGIGIDPDVYLRTVLDIMWAPAIKNQMADKGGTFHRYAVNVHGIPDNPSAKPEIRIILNVEDNDSGYSGKGLQLKWNELF
jgi:hypothetical protein